MKQDRNRDNGQKYELSANFGVSREIGTDGAESGAFFSKGAALSGFWRI